MARGCLNWRSWSPKLFEEAKAGRRPILLLATTFWAEGADRAPSALASEKAGVLLKDRVIPAWVDAERLPEVASQYGLADFPSCALLSPEGGLLCRFDPGAPDRLKDLLEAAAVVSGCDSAGLQGSCGEHGIPRPLGGGGSLERGMEALEAIRGAVDAALRAEAESPSAFHSADRAELIRFLLHYGRFTGSKEALERALSALHDAARSILYDPVEGGFFGGSGPRGRRTHKRLDENARWLLLALDASREPGGGFALPLARGILHYIQSRLSGPEGAFYSAQRADHGYYELSAEERRRVTPPAVDDTVYLNGNALAIAACCEGWRLLREDAYLKMATGAHRFIRERMTGPAGLPAHCFRQSPEGAGRLEEVAEMGWAELALYQATLDSGHLAAAGTFARAVAEGLAGLSSSSLPDLRPLSRAAGVPRFSRMEFDAGVRASGLLIHASAQLEDEGLAAPARWALDSLLEAAAPSLASQALLGTVLLAALYPVAVLEIVTDGSEDERRRVLARLGDMSLLHTVVSLRPPSKGESMMALPRVFSRCGSQRREIPLDRVEKGAC